jgi:hypothetical protein
MGYKRRRRSGVFKREFPHIVEVAVPSGGLGKRLDAMHTFHVDRGIEACLGRGRRVDNQDHLRWYFGDPTTAASFAIEFSGEFLTANA